MTSPLWARTQAVFGADGPLARADPQYRPRPAQLALAEAICTALEQRHALVAEAGTGVGKTFAYLVPLLLSGARALVSTATKSLQDQLYLRDLPRLLRQLEVPVHTALLKGRASYLCRHRLQQARLMAQLPDRFAVRALARVEAWAPATLSGDLAEIDGLDERSPVIPLVTSTRDNCLGSDCPEFRHCHVVQARREAMAADLVVVNHHLFFADMALRDSGVAELLPACNTVIFDEAHQLPETASLFFGENVSTAQLLDLARDARMEGLAAAKDFAELPEGARALEKAARDLRLAIPGENARFSLAQLPPAFHEALEKAAGELGHFGKLLESQAERSEGLEHCWRRAQELQLVLKRWRDVDEPGLVRWIEVFSQALSMNATPLFIADIFKKQMEGHPRAWIFTSATLAVESDFSHYCSELGLQGADTGCWGSPFDYPNQALLYAPQGLPDPNSRDYNQAVVEAAWPLPTGIPNCPEAAMGWLPSFRNRCTTPLRASTICG